MRSTRDELRYVARLAQATRFLTQYLDEPILELLGGAFIAADRAREEELPKFIADLRADVDDIRRDTGCRLNDEQTLRIARMIFGRGRGFVGVWKYVIDAWFGNYALVFPRWPFIPPHALVMFKTDLTLPSQSSILVPESELFLEVAVAWRQVRSLAGDGLDFMTRPAERQRELQAYLRIVVTAMYRCLEGYLNGLGFGCVREFHRTLDVKDHDVLTEWDSTRNRRAFVGFERKITDYPKIVGRYLKKDVDVSQDVDVQFIVTTGKDLRDSLTHMSPYLNNEGDIAGKVARLTTISVLICEELLRHAVSYISKIEKAVGRDPSRSAPWLKFPEELA